MFIDEVLIRACSGKGGDGAVHFRREKFVPFGGPDGGDGGKGGDVILVVLPTLDTLSGFRPNEKFQARNGVNGGSNKRSGKSGEDLIIHVPPGTVVFDNNTNTILGDLVEPGQRLVVCRGGRGGRGNARFATSRNQVPRMAEKGEPGEEKYIRLELKLIADVGIVGVPNAGKSTLLAALTAAKPKIAPYPFTTLEPNLGVAKLDENQTLILADIPGLIEGAHKGIGLGHDFLRHIQRTRALIHVLDGLAEDPLADFAQINSELALFDPQLADKPQVIAFNKIDIPGVLELWPNIELQLKQRNYQAYPISALTGANVNRLLDHVGQVLAELPPQVDVGTMPVYRIETDPREFQIIKTPHGFRVAGAAIERAAAMTYWEYDQSVRRFQKILETLGVDKALRQAGVSPGDTILIGDHELEWQD